MWNLKNYINEVTQETDSWTQKTNLWLPKGTRSKLRVWDQQIQTTIYKINNKALLTAQGTIINNLVRNHNGKECEIYIIYEVK